MLLAGMTKVRLSGICIDTLFSDTIKWDIIELHWQDMMQVVLSIQAGRISSSLLHRGYE